jgi:hypothetical protein
MMRLARAQFILLLLTLLSVLFTVAVGVATNVATSQIPSWAQPYIPLAWPSLIVLTALLLVITLASFIITMRQAGAEPSPPGRKLVKLYLQEVAAEPVRTLDGEVLDETAVIPREVTEQEAYGLFPRFAAAYRPGVSEEEEAEPEPLEKMLAREKRLVLLGEPGMGKTTSLRHLAQVEAQQALAGSGDISIYVELKNYAGEPELETLLARRVDDILKSHKLTLGYDEAIRTQVMRAWLATQDARFLILLDGLNEIAPNHRLSALNALEGLLSYPHRLLVSCRAQDYDKSLRECAYAFVLQGLQEDEILDYLRTRIGDRGETLFNEQIRRDEKMRTLVANPLMLWLVGEVARANPEARLPANRGQLLRTFAEVMPGLRRKEGVPMPNVSQDVVEAVLRTLAFTMQEHGPPPPDLGQVRGWGPPTATYRLEDILMVGKAWRFLKSDGSRGEPVEFLHLLFQEYFAAEYLAAKLQVRPDYKTVLGDRPFTEGWDEVTAMLAGICNRPGELVQWLSHEASARQQGRAALLVYRCLVTSNAMSDTEAHTAVADTLIGALGDPDPRVRSKAALALGKISDPRVVGHLIDALDDPNAEVRWGAVFALGDIGDPRAVGPLIRMLGDPYVQVRLWAVASLVKIGAPAVELLITALGNPDRKVRWGAAEALGRIGDPQALPELERVAREDTGVTWWDGHVADAAREAARRIRERRGS